MWECPEFSAFLRVHPALAIFLRPGNGDMPVRRLRSSAACDQPVHAPAYVTEVGLVATRELDRRAPRVCDVTECPPHGLPVHVAVTEVHPLVSILLALEVFQVHFDDALPQGANPVLRIAVKHHVPNIEPRLDPRTPEFL